MKLCVALSTALVLSAAQTATAQWGGRGGSPGKSPVPIPTPTRSPVSTPVRVAAPPPKAGVISPRRSTFEEARERARNIATATTPSPYALRKADESPSGRRRGGGMGCPPPGINPVALTLDSITADPAVKARAREAAREFRRLRVAGKKVTAAVGKLGRLRWHKTLPGAARAARSQGKPILWIQALGDLGGYT